MILTQVVKKMHLKGYYIIYHDLKRKKSYVFQHDPVAEVATEVSLLWDKVKIKECTQKELNYLYSKEEDLHEKLVTEVMSPADKLEYKKIQQDLDYLTSYQP